MPTSYRSSALVFTTALVAIAGACASTSEGPVVRDDPELLACPQFNAVTEAITVPTGGQWGFPIGGGHRIDFTEGAVPIGSRYRISAGPNAPSNGGDQGEIRIEPLDGAPTMFEREVFLTLNTAGCQGVAGSDLTVVLTEAGGSPRSIGGWYPQGRAFVRVLIPHLTTFALAR